jgi:SHS2 domain-containing protein
MTPGYELFDHTADLGVRVWAPSLAELVPPATDGFYATIGEVVAVDAQAAAASSPRTDAASAATAAGDVPSVHTFELIASDPALLLRDYLAELLFLFDTQQQRVVDVRVREFTPQRLVVTAQRRPIDTTRSALLREVKAVTYHELAIRPVTGGYEATFIVDI